MAMNSGAIVDIAGLGDPVKATHPGIELQGRRISLQNKLLDKKLSICKK